MNYIKIKTTLLFINLSFSPLILPPRLSLLYIKTVSRPFKRARYTPTLNLRPYIVLNRLVFTSSPLSSSSASTSTSTGSNNLSEETAGKRVIKNVVDGGRRAKRLLVY